MGFLQLSTPVPSTKRMLMSVWFRVPDSSIQTAAAEYQTWTDAGSPDPRPRLLGIVPIVVFGPPPRKRGYDFVSRVVGIAPPVTSYTWNDGIACNGGWTPVGSTIPAHSVMASHYVFNDTVTNLDPSYIGIDCSDDIPALSINLYMPNTSVPTIKGSFPVESEFSSSAVGKGLFGGAGICPGAPNYGPCSFSPSGVLPVANPPAGINSIFTDTTAYEGNADVLLGYIPELFRNLPGVEGGPDRVQLPISLKIVTPNRWHHLLFSFDCTKAVTVGGVNGGPSSTAPLATMGSRTSSAARMWIAYDDVNLTGKDLSYYHPTGYSDANAILTVNAFYVASDVTINTQDTVDDCFGNEVTSVQVQEKPTYNYQPAALPFSGSPFGLPATSTYVSNVKHIEMAELQMFTDKVLDTGVTTNRRAFITAKGKPAGMNAAAKLLGKTPEVKLHPAKNWIKGENTGRLAHKPPANGTTVGVIQIYKPDPSLHGEQGTAQ